MSKHEDIMARLDHHYFESEPHFGADNIVGIWLQGSQNYGLDYEGSDIEELTNLIHSIEHKLYVKTINKLINKKF